ncbi:MAG TPA: MBL fold metallo-hydrolase [Candidatus Methylomirabilis sp.]|nr:MBL fold metallo-hydrolase [Candidatus Methylomirabilis sp.]HSC70491.1 MBL fold metallo-hydrolase [Candidatus Methylomirabilis sp.]
MSLQITWYDNAAFRVSADEGVFWFDPSVNKNADSPIKTSDIVERAKFVFTTHGDPGHFVNSVEVTRRTGARFVGSRELCDFILSRGELPKEQVVPVEFEEPTKIDGLEVYLFEAEHPVLTPDLQQVMAKWGGSVPSRNGGFVVRGERFSLCILGDCIYSDVFREVGKRFRIDIGMIPIQGRMHVDSTPEEAAENGARILQALRPKVVFPVIQYTKERVRLEPLQRRLAELGVQTRMLFDRPGLVHTLQDI